MIPCCRRGSHRRAGVILDIREGSVADCADRPPEEISEVDDEVPARLHSRQGRCPRASLSLRADRLAVMVPRKPRASP